MNLPMDVAPLVAHQRLPSNASASGDLVEVAHSDAALATAS